MTQKIILEQAALDLRKPMTHIHVSMSYLQKKVENY